MQKYYRVTKSLSSHELCAIHSPRKQKESPMKSIVLLLMISFSFSQFSLAADETPALQILFQQADTQTVDNSGTNRLLDEALTQAFLHNENERIQVISLCEKLSESKKSCEVEVIKLLPASLHGECGGFGKGQSTFSFKLFDDGTNYVIDGKISLEITRR